MYNRFRFCGAKKVYTRQWKKGNQQYTYTTLGVKYFDEEMAEIFLLKNRRDDRKSRLRRLSAKGNPEFEG
ncbi:MAG: hypothetical protein L6V93_00600 [Clostridiales bacterium]|nr:MAG: hypothetical protein L6V93_00600 [Clostridiales bacterium]